MGKLDEKGFLYIIDRTRHRVISGGFNVFPRARFWQDSERGIV